MCMTLCVSINLAEMTVIFVINVSCMYNSVGVCVSHHMLDTACRHAVSICCLYLNHSEHVYMHNNILT